MASFDVVELPETDHVEEGDTAPDFTRPLVNTDYWEDVSLHSLLDDGPVLLVAYPMDGTGKARDTWINIRNRGWGEGDLTVVGISISTPYEHKHLIDEHELPHDLFSDPGADVAREYGITHDHHGMAGIVGHRNAMFLIDADGIVQHAWVSTRWPEEIPFDEIEDALPTA
jgi:peroxiredoxin